APGRAPRALRRAPRARPGGELYGCERARVRRADDLLSESARSRSQGTPPCARATCVHVDERRVCTVGGVGPDSTHERWILPLHSFSGLHDDPRVSQVYAAVSIQVVHPADVPVVHEDIRRIAVLMTAVGRTPFTASVVLRRAETGHYVKALCVVPHLAQLHEHELQLVDKVHTEHKVLRPDIRLVLGQEVAELEVLRQGGVSIL